ncbi:alkylresorcinol/alkylpyrone synthase [Actinoalloteichus hoggarensis]|uniref:Alpha-pyrone synthesis polyketide synthase-like Pks11 n=1 Tax=Actinoalloteichus hoggarensis TaxID=1470176 RepID=A0A221W5B7_9PSEU|nr:3-oxoacyl-[acyl-carrier-protein] synthase III C-terminal domain-containing protein [Actinoalloteichus hoggarensis]ASO20861.1 Alpha-pyrone synthesis polyketide synthase-like Pks11 [Actinoalloteichus hoggarensis]MBB5920793.1 alkylresorcinol/alkylpyrone synthase [Actinoalloteichus hoggarensis]
MSQVTGTRRGHHEEQGSDAEAWPTPAPRIAAAATALPEHVYRQEEILAAFVDEFLPVGSPRRRAAERISANSGVDTRHFAVPIDRLRSLESFTEANQAYLAAALDLGERAVRRALAEAGVRPDEVDLVVSTTVTGLAVPSLEARLAGRLGFREDVRRVPLFGLGCVAGAAGIARVADYLRAWPDQVAVLLSVELCSLTLQRDDVSVANVVGSSLFGDGAAAVVLLGGRRRTTGGSARLPAAGQAAESPAAGRSARGSATAAGPDGGPEIRLTDERQALPAITATRSRLYPDTEDVMGWDIGTGGFRLVLSADVPTIARDFLSKDVFGFLADHGLTVEDVGTWICHPGGPKVIDAVTESLGLPETALAHTRASLADLGNLSSASVLDVLRRNLAEPLPPGGTPGLLLAMGPGFCAELVLLRW